MEPTDPLIASLADLDEAGLGDLLRRRIDVVRHPAPRDLTELAERLCHPASLTATLSTLPLPALELVEVLTALAGAATLERAVELLEPVTEPVGQPGGRTREEAHRQQVEDVLDLLVQVGLVRREPAQRGDRDERVVALPQVRALLASPLGLHEPLEQMLAELTVAQLHQLQGRLGLPGAGNRATVTASLVRHLSDRDTVRALLAEAPPHVAGTLREMAAPEPDDLCAHGFADRTQASWERRRRATEWGVEHGLLYRFGWSYASGARMPSQVALALLEDLTVPFHGTRPELITVAVEPRQVESESSVMATEFVDHAVGVLDQLARRPATALKSGGVGAREVTRLAKAVGCDPAEARTALELAHAAGLLEPGERSVAVGGDFAQWRATEPGARLATLVQAWALLLTTPTRTHDAWGKSLPALAQPDGDPGPLSARWAMLGELAALDADHGTTRESLAERVGWSRPLADDSVGPEDEPLALVWQEAQLLGVLALGSLSPLGRALVGHDTDALRTAADRLLPSSTDVATFGTDLTAMVIGSPSAEVAGLLDTAADRERGSGGATTWRFSAASVRRALDEGHAADRLLDRLTAMSRGDLPQPLRYLVSDVARRHGLLRVSGAVSVIRCPDEALLAEASVDRKLRRLGLRLIAPTVLACAVPAEEAIAAMRAAGYFPMPDGATPPEQPAAPAAPDLAEDDVPEEFPDNVVDLLALAARRNGTTQPPTVPAPQPLTPASLAGALTGLVTSQQAGTETERVLRGMTRRLSGAEVRDLAFALDHQRAVHVVYQSGTGGISERVVSGMRLLGGSIWAWCHLRSGEREFRVDRIHSVAPVDP